MIPKIIHYCWFGKKPLDKKAQKCIKTWRRFFPDYEIKEWNESNFNVNMFHYTAEAYEAEKWAFVSDVARVFALYQEGGIYFDTDVEVIRSFDQLVEDNVVFGLEKIGSIATCVMISPPKAKIFHDILDSYRDKRFFNNDGTLNYTPNPTLFSNELRKYGFLLNHEEKIGEIIVLGISAFTPYDNFANPVNLTEQTYSIHHFAASWLPSYRKQDNKRKKTHLFKCKSKIRGLYHRIINKFIRIVCKFNPLLGKILNEQSIDKRKSYKLSRRYGGVILVYKNSNVYFSPTAVIDIRGTLKIGIPWPRFSPSVTNFVVGDSATLLVKGDFRIMNGSRVSVNNGAKLILGDNGLINLNGNIRCFSQIVIGNGVRISENCILSDSDNHDILYNGREQIKSKPIIISDHVLIGLNCIILKGVNIGQGSIVGAGSVVTKTIPSKSLVAGIPAKIIRENACWE